MGLRKALAVAAMVVIGVVGLTASAQDSVPTMPPDTTGGGCAAALEALWTTASDSCVSAPEGFVCNGGALPIVEPAGPVANALAPVGALVETALVDSIQTAPLTPETGSVGIAWLRPAEPLRLTMLMIGAVSLRDVTMPEFPAWQSMQLRTAPEPSSCLAAPVNALVLQSPLDLPVRVAVNGISLNLNGTVHVRAANNLTTFVGLSGASSVIAQGQEQSLFAGQEISVNHNPDDYSRPSSPPTQPFPFEVALTRYLPVPLFDRPFVLPQPGFVTTQGTINLRVFPSTDAGIIIEVPAGQTATVLGRNPASDWFHVRLPNGLTGWMKADLLRASVGQIEAVYDATPVIPQRFGAMGRTGVVLAQAGVNLRVGPDPGFPALAAINGGTVVTLLARSPYSSWIKVDANGLVGWVALIAIDTRAFIDALPIDFNVPPQPTPTLIPGSFGNAFPDPDGPGN